MVTVRPLYCLASLILIAPGALADSPKAEAILLFNGKSLEGWTTIKGQPVTRGWEVTPDGALHRKTRGGHIISKRAFANFDLRLEWKIAPKGNSGIKYKLIPHQRTLWGCEFQIYDDSRLKNPRAKNSCGSLYAMYPPNEKKKVKPVGQWNTTRIVVKGTKIEHWLNGEKIVEADTASEDWKKRIARSKYRPVKNFAPTGPTKIMLQDHGSEVWFRNITIRPLP